MEPPETAATPRRGRDAAPRIDADPPASATSGIVVANNAPGTRRVRRPSVGRRRDGDADAVVLGVVRRSDPRGRASAAGGSASKGGFFPFPRRSVSGKDKDKDIESDLKPMGVYFDHHDRVKSGPRPDPSNLWSRLDEQLQAALPAVSDPWSVRITSSTPSVQGGALNIGAAVRKGDQTTWASCFPVSLRRGRLGRIVSKAVITSLVGVAAINCLSGGPTGHVAVIPNGQRDLMDRIHERDLDPEVPHRGIMDHVHPASMQAGLRDVPGGDVDPVDAASNSMATPLQGQPQYQQQQERPPSSSTPGEWDWDGVPPSLRGYYSKMLGIGGGERGGAGHISSPERQMLTQERLLVRNEMQAQIAEAQQRERSENEPGGRGGGVDGGGAIRGVGDEGIATVVEGGPRTEPEVAWNVLPVDFSSATAVEPNVPVDVSGGRVVDLDQEMERQQVEFDSTAGVGPAETPPGIMGSNGNDAAMEVPLDGQEVDWNVPVDLSQGTAAERNVPLDVFEGTAVDMEQVEQRQFDLDSATGVGPADTPLEIRGGNDNEVAAEAALEVQRRKQAEAADEQAREAERQARVAKEREREVMDRQARAEREVAEEAAGRAKEEESRRRRKGETTGTPKSRVAEIPKSRVEYRVHKVPSESDAEAARRRASEGMLKRLETQEETRRKRVEEENRPGGAEFREIVRAQQQQAAKLEEERMKALFG